MSLTLFVTSLTTTPHSGLEYPDSSPSRENDRHVELERHEVEVDILPVVVTVIVIVVVPWTECPSNPPNYVGSQIPYVTYK